MQKLYDACIKNCWYAAGISSEFPNEKLTGQVICDRPMVIWRTREGRIVAYDNRCPHKRFPLSDGALMPDGTLRCAYHGLHYNADSGKCVLVPSQPDRPISPMAAMRPIPVLEQDGVVWVWPGDPDQAAAHHPPRMPEIVDPAWSHALVGPIKIPAHYLLLIENLLDITHFYPLHDGNIGDLENSRIPMELAEGEEDGNRFCGTVRRVTGYRQPPYLVDWFHYEVVDRLHTHFMRSPATTRVAMRNWPAGQEGRADLERGYVLHHLHTPVNAQLHSWRVVVTAPAHHMAKGDPTQSTAARVAAMFPDVAAEDRWALEKQDQMIRFPDQGYHELYLSPDAAVRAGRKIFADLLRQETPDPPANARPSVPIHTAIQ